MVEGVHASVAAIETMEEACGRFSRAVLERLPEIQAELRRVTEALEDREDELRREIAELEEEIASLDEGDDGSGLQSRLDDAEDNLKSIRRRRRKLEEAATVYAVQASKAESLSCEHNVKAKEFLQGTAQDISSYLRLNLGSDMAGPTKVDAGHVLSSGPSNTPQYLFDAPVNGKSRQAHRAGANRLLYQRLKSDTALLDFLNRELRSDVVRHMESGKNLLNPPGTEWHHPHNDPSIVRLLRKDEHAAAEFQSILHPDGVGGFGTYYGS